MILSWLIKFDGTTFLKCTSDKVIPSRGDFVYTTTSITPNHFKRQATYIGDLPLLRDIKLIKVGKDYA